MKKSLEYGELCRAAACTVIAVYRAASGRPDSVPGMVGAIQQFGHAPTTRNSESACPFDFIDVDCTSR